MLEKKEREQLIRQANEYKNEISRLRRSLNELSNQKESLFLKKQELDKRLSSSINNIKRAGENTKNKIKSKGKRNF